MAKTIAEAWVEEGEAKGALRTARSYLRLQLEERFGPLPEALSQQLEAITDPARFLQAARQVVRIGKLEDLQL